MLSPPTSSLRIIPFWMQIKGINQQRANYKYTDQQQLVLEELLFNDVEKNPPN